MTVRGRRKSSYWEPFFAPNDVGKFLDGNWENFDHEQGPTRQIFRPSKLDFIKIKLIYFKDCDFEGDFSSTRFVFDRCTFEACDFGLSTFRNAKFTDCKFVKTSFTQSTISDSQFRGCIFDSIGISGNETKLDRTIITNPGAFIRGASTNISHLPDGISPFEQRMRLIETKSTLSRTILNNFLREGPDSSYYEAVKVSTLAECLAKAVPSLIFARRFFRRSGRDRRVNLGLNLFTATITSTSAIAEFIILYAFGLLNGWGSSLSRTVFLGIVVFATFGLVYMAVASTSFLSGFRMALEVGLLFGYTDHTKQEFPHASSIVFSNAIAGLIWYIVAVPTVVGKLTRTRA